MPEPKLTLEALQVIDAIERRGSFARAAEELNKATSALSYSVQKLEEQLGVTLYERQGRKSILTAAGRLLLEEGRKILEASRLLANRTRELAQGWEPRIRIALESTCSRAPFFKVLAEFLSDHPSLEIDLAESVLNGGWEALEHDQIDLLVGAPGPVPQHKGFRSKEINSTELLLVAAKHHPLAKLRTEPGHLKQALEKTRRIVMHDTSSLNVVRSAGLLSSEYVMYVQTLEQKIAAQLAGIGVGHLPREAIKPYLQSGELIILAEQTDRLNDYIAWKTGHRGKGLQELATQLSRTDW